MSEANLTDLQWAVLREIKMRGHLTPGWSGYSLRTLRSLARRGLVDSSLGLEDRFHLTASGREILATSKDV